MPAPVNALRGRARAAIAGMRWWLGLCAACLVAGASDAAVAQGTPSEAAVEAAYLYKFLAYVQWPVEVLAPGDSTIVVGVAGGDAVLAELQPLMANRRVDGHPIQARRQREGESIEGLHVLYVGRSGGGASALRDWVQRLRGRPVLIVTDVPDGLERGAMLALVPVDGRVRFVASVAAAELAGLRLSARLLAVADRVVVR